MEVGKALKKIPNFLKKYRYAALILVIGLFLMMLPSTTQDKQDLITNTQQDTITELALEDKLSTILSKVDGAGEVQVLLTVLEGEETVYQTDDDTSHSSDTSSTNFDTVTVTDASRNQTGLIRQIIPETYMGAIVVCQGANDPNVRLSIVEAVSKLTGLGANKISVLKMK